MKTLLILPFFIVSTAAVANVVPVPCPTLPESTFVCHEKANVTWGGQTQNVEDQVQLVLDISHSTKNEGDLMTFTQTVPDSVGNQTTNYVNCNEGTSYGRFANPVEMTTIHSHWNGNTFSEDAVTKNEKGEVLLTEKFSFVKKDETSFIYSKDQTYTSGALSHQSFQFECHQ